VVVEPAKPVVELAMPIVAAYLIIEPSMATDLVMEPALAADLVVELAMATKFAIEAASRGSTGERERVSKIEN
jgi:hypothetical protein